MASVRDVALYLYLNYPFRSALSKARLVKLIYLADWRSSIERGKQLTDTKWYFNHFGPYVNDIIEILKQDSDFRVLRTENMFGDFKELITANTNARYTSTLLKEEKKILDHIITVTSDLSWNDFIKLVYSTYPILRSERGSTLNLVELALEYTSQPEYFKS